VIDRVEIEERLLHRLSGGLGAEELSGWARSTLALASAEGPALFAPEEAMLLDVLKRCSVAADPPFALSENDLEALLRRVAFSGGPAAPNGRAKGPFLVAFRARLAPARLFPIVGVCGLCGAAVRISPGALPKVRQTKGALVCFWCARTVPGMVVSDRG
jgi:hypothetical protein